MMLSNKSVIYIQVIYQQNLNQKCDAVVGTITRPYDNIQPSFENNHLNTVQTR
jgi:hypothetical protein